MSGKLYVGNLPPDANDREVEKLFKKYGRLLDVDVKNRHESSFAFLEFESPRDAEEAVYGRDNYKYDGRTLNVQFSKGNRRDGSGGGYRGGGRGGYRDNDRFGSRDDRYGGRDNDRYGGRDSDRYGGRDNDRYGGRNDRFGGDRYDDRRNGRGGGRFNRPKARSTQWRAYVTGLPSSTSWQDLKDHMKAAAEVSYADANRDGTGVCDFHNEEDLNYAIKKMHNSELRTFKGDSAVIRLSKTGHGSAGGGAGSSGKRDVSFSRSRSQTGSSRSRSPPSRRKSPAYSDKSEEKRESRSSSRSSSP